MATLKDVASSGRLRGREGGFPRSGLLRLRHNDWTVFGKRYYMDLDGIMQTGTITVDDQNYELQAAGSLKK